MVKIQTISHFSAMGYGQKWQKRVINVHHLPKNVCYLFLLYLNTSQNVDMFAKVGKNWKSNRRSRDFCFKILKVTNSI